MKHGEREEIGVPPRRPIRPTHQGSQFHTCWVLVEGRPKSVHSVRVITKHLVMRSRDQCVEELEFLRLASQQRGDGPEMQDGGPLRLLHRAFCGEETVKWNSGWPGRWMIRPHK